MAALQLAGFDRHGRELWRNFKTNAMSESPASVFNKVYVDAGGKPVLAPHAVKLARDTRLAAGQARAVSFALPPGVARVEVIVVLRLVAPALAAMLGLDGTPEAGPRVVESQRFERP